MPCNGRGEPTKNTNPFAEYGTAGGVKDAVCLAIPFEIRSSFDSIAFLTSSM